MKKKPGNTFFLIIIALFLSGASALIYQVLWTKQLTLIFGSQTLAISTIITCFMGGLSIGSFLLYKYGKKISDVVKVYGIFELIIGIYALLIPFIFSYMDVLYQQIWIYIDYNSFSLIFIRFLLCFLVLILPTTLMGATLSLIIKYYVTSDKKIIEYTSLLYAINTLGAVIGTYAAGFYLIQTYGISNTNFIAVILNFLAAILAFIVYFQYNCQPENINIKAEKNINLRKLTYIEKAILACMLISGFTAMVYEIVWTRQLILIYGSTVYSFASMLFIFLSGVSAGSFFAKRVFKSVKNGLTILIVMEMLIAVCVYSGSIYFKGLIFLFNYLSNILLPDLYSININLCTALLVLPPALLFGAIFPISIKLFTPDYKEIIERSSLLYTFNTFGCILGSISTPFILLPLLGLKGSLYMSASLNILIAVILITCSLFSNRFKYIYIGVNLFIALLIIFLPARWEKSFVSLGTYVNKSARKTQSIKKYFENLQDKEIVYYREGQHSTISVVKWVDKEDNENYSLYSNGKIEASTFFKDMRNQSIIAYLPAMLMKKHEKALIIGMGSGITASVLAKFPFDSIEMVELEKDILPASKYFANDYGDPLNNKKVTYIIDDARNYLKITPQKYDLIISEPSNVWVNGVASLFTREYYKIIKSKLTKKGILCQWIQIYDLELDSIMSVLKSIKSEFKYIYICHSKTSEDLIFLASESPFKLNLSTIHKNINFDETIKKDLLKRFNITNKYDFMNLFLVNPKKLRKMILSNKNEIPMNTDDNSYLEFKAAQGFYKSRKSYFQEVYPKKLFKHLNGLTNDDFFNPGKKLFLNISKNIKTQFARSENLFNKRESFEWPLYKEQMLSYAIKQYKLDSDNVENLDFLGQMYMYNYIPSKGIRYLLKAVKKNSTNSDTYKYLARYYNRLIMPEYSRLEPEKALKYSLKAKKIDPNNNYINLLIAISYFNLNKTSKALKYIDIYEMNCKKQSKKPVYEYYVYKTKAYKKGL